MGYILKVKDQWPVIGEECFIAENATIAGYVTIGSQSSVWFNAVLRGDVNTIEIGKGCNIQDGVVIHGTFEKAATTIADHVSIGHHATIHGCTIGEFSLVGMGTIVLDHAVVEPYCMVGAGSLVLEKMRCESGYLYAGSPARKIKPLTAEQRNLLATLPERYRMYAGWYQAR